MAERSFVEPPSPTKITYIDGEPATITLRRCCLESDVGGVKKRHVFETDTVDIGATNDNDLVLTDDTVSRNHCRIFKEGEAFLVRDLGSTNGTFINRVRVREAWLKPGCSLMLGKTELSFSPVDEKLRIVPSDKERLGGMIGKDARMRAIYAMVERIAPTDTTVVVTGETGTGKEVVARTLHDLSRRQRGPFIVFDCGAVPENLIESELFGHEKGAFTGATNARQGVFEMAQGGTVFLDELGELGLDLQPKLLRVLEQREVKRVGGVRPTKVDVRVVAATNRDLEAEVRAGRFREDLFYRLNVVRLELPPLRARPGDVPLLVRHFLSHGAFNELPGGGRRVRDVSRTALEHLCAHAWPGNVRELSNVIERAVSFAETDEIRAEDLPESISGLSNTPLGLDSTNVELRLPSIAPPDVRGAFKGAKDQWVQSFEREYIESLLRRNDGNISHAAREAEID
ncbi:MAG: FHA domain-containing protein, partial [Myxococcales bacterium]|nr:FHA domain-containing protein [Myxococcales bacterium]